MTGLNQQEFEVQVAGLLGEAIEVERNGLYEPKFSDFHNQPGKPGLNFPEPYDEGRPSTYDRAMGHYQQRLATKKVAERAEAEAHKIINQHPQIRVRICEALKSVNEDAKDLAKIVCAALIPLSLAGTIALPLTPIVCVGVGLVVWRAGTSGFCTGVGEPKK